MVVARSSLVPETVHVEGLGGSRQRFLRNKLLVANGGDSRAVLGRLVDGKLTAVELSSPVDLYGFLLWRLGFVVGCMEIQFDL